jgi:DNA-binding LytR/AlgR family response regulator
MKLRAIIVDREPLGRDNLSFLLEQCEHVDVVAKAGCAAEARRLCDEHQPQVAFIDLGMPELDGITLATQLRRQLPKLDVIIVSAHEQAALRGFDTRVTDYLLKPVRLRRLYQALDRVSMPTPPDHTERTTLLGFAVRRKDLFLVVELRAIVYFEVRDGLVWAVTERDRFALDTRLTALWQRLDDKDFFQSHRRCIVRIDRIRKIEPIGARTFRLLLDHPDDPRVPLARDRTSKLRERIPFVR